MSDTEAPRMYQPKSHQFMSFTETLPKAPRPFYHDLKETQQKIYNRFNLFPLQSHSDFLVSYLFNFKDCNYEAIVVKCTEQLGFLFDQCSPPKPNETIRALKQENEQYKLQIESLRMTTSETRVSPKHHRNADDSDELRLIKFELT